MNPAYSRVVGTFGVWNEGELSSVPGGHFLVTNQAVAPVNPTAPAGLRAGAVQSVQGHANVVFKESASVATVAASGLPPLALGPVMAEIDGANSIVSLDLCNAIPEFTLDGDKYDYGPIAVGVQVNGSFQQIGSFTNYDKDSYNATSGLVDVPFQSGVTWANVEQWLQQGNMALQVQQANNNVIASLEFPLTYTVGRRCSLATRCRAVES